MARGKHVILLDTTTITSVADTAVYGSWVLGVEQYEKAVFLMTIDNKTFDASTTMNVYVQTSPDEGVTADDLVSFSQITNAATGDGTYVAYLNPAASAADRATASLSLTANSVRSIPMGDRIRVVYVPANVASVDTIDLKVEALLLPRA